MCCVFVSLINMEKVPEVDLLWYVANYSYASHMDFLPYIRVATNSKLEESLKEPLYGALVWVLNRTFNGNIPLFQFSISIIIYLPLVVSIILLGIKLNFRMMVVIVGIVWMCFYPYIFTHAMNLLRQTIANTILCYVMIKHFFYGKKEWVGIISMTLFHSSSTLFVPLLLFPAIGKPFQESKIWYVGSIAGLAMLKVITTFFLSFGMFEEEEGIGYTLSRSQYGVGSYDALSFFSVLGLLLILFYSAYLFFSKRMSRIEGLGGFSFVLIFLSIFLLLNFDNHQFALRFVHYLFTFVPFLLMLFFEKNKINNHLLMALSLAIIVLFTIYLDTGFWTFNVVAGGWFTPVFGYIL